MTSRAPIDFQQIAAAANRAAFPGAARIVDEFREVFGAEVKLLWAAENGREIGVRPASIVPSPGSAVRA